MPGVTRSGSYMPVDSGRQLWRQRQRENGGCGGSCGGGGVDRGAMMCYVRLQA